MILTNAERVRQRAVVIIVSLVMLVLALVALTYLRKPAAPAAPLLHTLDMRLDGDGVGQLARVWDATGERDVESWAGPWQLVEPRGALFIVQAGGNQTASCVILLDGTEVARVAAEPLTTATCAWVR